MLHQRRNIDSFVLLYGISGTLYIADGGREYAISSNDYLILAANREHVGTQPSPPGLSYYWCHFYIKENYSLYEDGTGREHLSFGDSPAFRLPMTGTLPSASKTHLLFHQLIDSSRTAHPLSDLICQDFLEILLAEIASASAGAEGTRPAKDALVQNVVEWIRLNASQIRHVGEAADYFGYNTEYLTTVLKKATGRSLIQHIRDNRIDCAKKLLCTTNLTVRQIADASGFPDEKYFSRIFKQACDISPTAFRNTYTKQHLNDK